MIEPDSSDPGEENAATGIPRLSDSPSMKTGCQPEMVRTPAPQIALVGLAALLALAAGRLHAACLVNSLASDGPLGVGSRAFFVVTDGVGDAELWLSDGSRAGTRRVVELGARPRLLGGAGGALLFALGGALWRSDGSAGGTVRIAPVAPVGLYDLAVVGRDAALRPGHVPERAVAVRWYARRHGPRLPLRPRAQTARSGRGPIDIDSAGVAMICASFVGIGP